MLVELERLMAEFVKGDFTYQQMTDLLSELGDCQYYPKRAKKMREEGNYQLAFKFDEMAAETREYAQKMLDEYGLKYKVEDLI